MINLHETFTSCSQRNTNSKYLNKIWQLIKYSLLVVTQCWHHNVSQVQASKSQLVLSVATLLRWWKPGSLTEGSNWQHQLRLASCHILLNYFELLFLQLQLVKISCKLITIWVNYEKGGCFLQNTVYIVNSLLSNVLSAKRSIISTHHTAWMRCLYFC